MKRFYESKDEKEDEGEEEATKRSPKKPKVGELHRLSCFRESPLISQNEGLVNQLAIIRKHRYLIYSSSHHKFIAYATAVSSIISYPYEIKSKQEALTLPNIGESIATKIEEYLSFGTINEAVRIAKSEEFKVLSLLHSVHGIGPKSAVELYKKGIKSMEDLKKLGKYNLTYHDDIQIKIPRTEVESVRDFIQIQLNKIDLIRKSGLRAVIEIGGGYRRGKEESNDIDLIITYPHSEGAERGVLNLLLKRLHDKGLIPPGGELSKFHTASNRTSKYNLPATHLDCLDKSLIIFKHAANNTTRERDYYRRVDLVFSSWNTYGSAILGWTGSTQWERDIRKHAEALGYIFESGGLRRVEGNVHFDTPHERDIFRMLGMDWIPPHLRNADPSGYGI